ncbi:MAG TPA: site-specific integrase [Chloroflexia bacterium]
MSRLPFVDAVALSRAPDFGSIAACEKLQTWFGLPQHLPFIIDDEGVPIRSVNSWLSQLHADGSLSYLTWKAYAQDWLDWYRFLANRGIDPLSATGDHIKHYHAERRIGVAGLDRVLKATSWNRMVAALDSYYKWALQKELIERVPFTYREVRIYTSQGGSTKVKLNMAKEKGARQHATLKWLEKDYLRTFLDVGITGLLPTGEEDPTFRGQNTARNRAFAELLATSGLRVQEASHLLTTEIPEVPKNPVKFVRMELPASICKRQKARWVLELVSKPSQSCRIRIWQNR